MRNSRRTAQVFVVLLISAIVVLLAARSAKVRAAGASIRATILPQVSQLMPWMNKFNGVFSVAAAEPQQASFPSLSEQLRSSKVRTGSAFEQLIKDNQDFSMLRADESTDKRGLPPWIRVWWRKAHPELKYTADDPTGGYPLVLKEIVEWMEWHQDLRPSEGQRPTDSSSLLEKLIKDDDEEEEAEEAERLMAPNSTFTGEQRISGAQSTARSESDIRINFFDPTKILSASNAITAGGQQAIFYSLDSGATWGQTSLPLTSTDTSHSDPTVDWTSDGSGWSSTIGIVGGTLRMRNYVSVDNGASWTLDATFSGSQTSTDKQMVWVDHSASSPFFNQQYAIWHNGQPAFMSRRTAGAGGTWSAPIQVSGAESTGTAIGNDVKTNSAGDVFGFWPTTTNARVFVTKSTNGGTSYGTPVQIASTFDTFDIGVPSFNNRRALIYISGGAYKTMSKNMVYAAWTDLSGDSGCTAAANEPGSNVASTCKTRVWFSRSTDGGATWSAKVKVNNQAGLNDQFNQWLAVDETTGALGIMYYDTVNDAGRKKVDVWYQHSFDDGATWGAAEKVTTAQTDETAGGQDSGNQFGDYNGLSAYAGVLFPSWTDRRGGAREEIYTVKINDAACTIPGAPTAVMASATGANQITVGWTNGSPAAAKYNVYRATGTCAAPGVFALLAANVAATSFVDSTVSGGTTYSYKITGLDATGACESPLSTCGEATATGICTLPPTFGGLTSVTNAATASCTLNLAWSAATANCAGPVSYNIYRSTTNGFVPAPGNLLTTTTGTSFSDTTGLMSGVTYFYVVRAVDTSNSMVETNTVQQSGTPTGPVAVGTLTETFEGAGGFDNAGWTHQALSGTTDWVWSTTQSQTPTHSWFSASQPSVSERVLVSPSFVVNASTTLSFWHTFAFESATSCFDGGTLEYSTNGTTWTVMPDANFTAGGFTGTVSSSFSNPIGGKRAYCNGTIGAMTQVNVNLASLAGNTIQLRWHEGDDSSAVATGWFVDSITIANAGIAGSCSSFVCPTITVTNPAIMMGTAGAMFSQSFTQTGGVGATTFSTASPLPSGLTLNPSGSLSGIPTQTGVFSITVTATDSNMCTGTGAPYMLVIGCPTIAVTNPATATGTAGSAFNQTFTQAGGVGAITFTTVSTLPTGLTLSTGGVLSGTPTQTGTFPIEVKATDANGCMGMGSTYTLVIGCQTITVTNPVTTTGTAGTAFSQTFTQTGGIGATTFSTASTLPTGLMLSTGGVLSGTPTQTGTFPIEVKATDANGCMGTGSTYTLVIGCQTITVTNPVTTTGTTGAPFSQTFTQTGGIGATTFSTASTLPTGLTLSTGGVLSGTPTQTGTFPIEVKVTDANGCMGTGSTYTLVIGCQTITVTNPVTTTGTTGAPFSQTFTQTGGIGATTFSTASTLPTGLMLSTGGVLSGTPTQTGTFSIVVKVTDANGCMGTGAIYTLVLSAPSFTPMLTETLVNPLGASGPGDVVSGGFSIPNGTAAPQTGSVTINLQAGLVGLMGTCIANYGTCTINATTVTWNGTIPAGVPKGAVTATLLNVTYQAQIANNAAFGATLCAPGTATFGAATATATACITVGLQQAGPGLLPDGQNAVSDQKPGSVLVYPIYSSSAANAASQNTRIAITNTSSNRNAFVHLFFVDGSSCSVADSYICLTPNQTASLLASDVDPGTTGYLIAVAVNSAGCPISFNHLIGDEFVKLASGHQSNLGAESIAAVAGGLTACNPLVDNNAVLAFNNVSYNALPRVLASSNIPSRGDGNDTYVVIDRIGGNLSTSGSTIGGLFGILYDDAEAAYSFSLGASACQSTGSITNDRPRTVPRFETVVPSGRTGWFKLWGASDVGIVGSQINRNNNAATNPGAFNHGHNLHKLTYTTTSTLTIPVFPPSC